MSERAEEQQDVGTKVHGDKLGHASAAGRTAAAPDVAAVAGAPAAVPESREHPAEPGTGGLMPGSYEQGGGEAGHRPGEGAPVIEAVRAPGSRVPDPKADPRLREVALDIAEGGHHR